MVIDREVDIKVKREQHDYILHQQLQAIQNALGEKSSSEEQLAELRPDPLARRSAPLALRPDRCILTR